MNAVEREAQIRDAVFRMTEAGAVVDGFSFSLGEVAFLLERLDTARTITRYQVQFGSEMKELAARLEAGLLRVIATEHAADIWFAHEDCITAAKKALDGPYTAHKLSPASTPASRPETNADSVSFSPRETK